MQASLRQQRAFSSASASKPLRVRQLAPTRHAPPAQQSQRVRAIELDFSDPDTQLSVAGVVLGLLFGLGAPAFYINRTERDEERLEELRALNRSQYQETGEYMSDVSFKEGCTFTSATFRACSVF